MAIRAIAVDIDGTVTDYDKLIDWKGVNALRRAEIHGIPVVVATGNIGPVTKAFSSFVGLTGPLVAENGGVVFSSDMRRRKLLGDRKPAQTAYRKLVRAGLPVRPIWSDEWRLSEVAIELNVSETDVRRVLDGDGVDVVATRFAIHIMQPGFDKFNGLKTVLPWIDVAQPLGTDEVLAIGDSNNDEHLLRGCGASGCVANGSKRAQRAAQYVAKKNHGAGVAEILRHFRVGQSDSK